MVQDQYQNQFLFFSEDQGLHNNKVDFIMSLNSECTTKTNLSHD